MAHDSRRCPKGTLLFQHDRTVKPTPNWCGTWRCPRCGPIRARKLRARLVKTTPNRFITLTLRPQPGVSAVQLLDIANRAWSILWRRLRRRFGPKAVGYAKVVELTKRGTPHLHILVTMPYYHRSALSADWRELTGSFIVDIRKVDATRGLGGYLTSYLTKAMGVPQDRRKWSSSAGYVPPAEETPYEEGELPPRCHWYPANLVFITAGYLAAGYVISNGWLFPPDLAFAAGITHVDVPF